MYLAIIVLPLLGSIISGFFGRKIGIYGAQIITCGSVIITTMMAILAFIEVGLNNTPVSIQLFRWIDSESLNVIWGFYFDSLTVSMLIPVLIVSSLVHIYSIGYMNNDPHNQRFFSYLSLFTFMMIILVTANNFLLMFVGWEGVGICSYLLVSFWFTRIAANQSSISAFLTNRVGDCFLTIGMFAILWSFGNIDYSTVFSLAPYLSENIITIIGICLLIGAMAKSSQVGLHVWLPMAMEGPTPVSALIHAATMVTAGVYLLMRTSPLIEYSSTVLILSLWIGAITTVFSSLIGLFQQDIKKVIAYSTMSQLGMMVIAIGLSSYNIALFHLVNHAFYKGLLFLGAGAVIHAVADNQDFRKYGGLKPFLPLTYSVMLIASLSLVAFPFMTGFYSKDFILESAYGKFYFSSVVIYYIAIIGAMFTTLYSVKVLYLTFLTNPNGPLIYYKQAHESDIYMSLPLIVLAIFSIFFGYITKDIFLGLGSNFFADNSLFIHPSHEIMLDTEFAVPTIFKLLPLILTISLSLLALILSELLPKLLIFFKFSRLGYNIYSFFNQRFLIELFYNKYITSNILKLGGQTTKIIDKGSIELLGPYGLEKGLLSLSKNIASLDTSVITSYALYILIGLIFYIITPYLYLTNNSYFLIILFGLFSITNNKTINNPPKPHTFINVSIQSNFDLNIIKVIKYKIFNVRNIIAILFTSLIIFYTRLSLLYFGFPADFSFILINAFKGIKTITSSIVGDGSNTLMMYAYNDETFLNKNDKDIIPKDININYMDRDKIEQFQQIPILGQANPDNKWNQWKPGMKPIPGSVTPDVEDMCFTLPKKLEWIEFFQKKRLELYESEPLMKEINLDLLDKKSNIAQHKLKELIDARQGLEQWQKYGDDFWQIFPPYSVRTTQQDCVKQLIEINKNLGRPTSPDYLFLTAKNRENYLRVNKAWSVTFDGLYKDQVNRSYFPETKYESPKVEFYRSGSPMQESN
jgi:NADH-ubiquinone oxidoreductase chain 5